MKFRFKALGWHFGASMIALLLILGTLYLGWYRWPGWYLSGLLSILPIIIAVDAVLGPLLTFIIASPSKPKSELARDIAVIVGVQLLALGYGAFTMWSGRPLYYAYSGNELSVVQASDLEPAEINLGRQTNPDFAPYWYSRPRWVYAPNPAAGSVPAKSAQSLDDFSDSTETPSDMLPWSKGVADLRKKLQKVDDWKYFTGKQKEILKRRMAEQGYAVDAANTIPMTGKGAPLLAIFDTNSMTIRALLRAD
jgi:hypothetical protein